MEGYLLFIEPASEAKRVIKTTATNDSNTLTASIATEIMEASTNTGYLVIVQGTNETQHFELHNAAYTSKPITDPAWLDGSLLTFDVWTSPHYGIHYVVDTKRRKTVHAARFSDSYIQNLQRKSNLEVYRDRN